MLEQPGLMAALVADDGVSANQVSGTGGSRLAEAHQSIASGPSRFEGECNAYL